jgi:hypothetical protein
VIVRFALRTVVHHHEVPTAPSDFLDDRLVSIIAAGWAAGWAAPGFADDVADAYAT